MSSEKHVLDLLPAYALSCLDEADAVFVEDHLASCPVCRSELQMYEAIASQLPLVTTQIEPPARVKTALMERIRTLPLGAGKPEPKSTAWERFLSFSRKVSPTWSLAGLALVLILAASNLLLWRQVNRLQAEALTSRDAMQVITLRGTASAPQATGLLVVSLDGEHGTLVVDKLPDLSQEQEYQLWLIDEDGGRTSGGVFSVRKGYGSVWVSSPEPLISYPNFGVTIEPAGGSPEPTGERVLGGEL